MKSYEQIAIERWNAQADMYNQWSELDGDERGELIEAVRQEFVAKGERDGNLQNT